MTSEQFYANLHTFSDFSSLGDDANYKTLPLDWFVVISDVRGSTKAIEQGRYQDVNTIGAASVAVLGQLWKDNAVPFVFGGDGASILVPPSRLDAVTQRLLKLKNMALANYDLELRVGVVPMKDIIAQGLQIEVAKFASGPAKPIAFIRGGGLSWADTQIKAKPDVYCLKNLAVGALDAITDLSCRWQPMKSRRGTVLSVLARSAHNDIRIFRGILDTVSEILGGDFQHSSPVHLDNKNYKTIWQSLATEFRYHTSHLNRAYFARVFSTAFSVWSIRGQRQSPFDAKRYTASIPSHSDFRKFDDMLRLVIDCTPEQVDKIRAHLETLHRSGAIFFGLHESDHAIMTCLIGSVGDGDHIHFIDGGEGGYAVAAKFLKEQIAVSAADVHLAGAAL